MWQCLFSFTIPAITLFLQKVSFKAQYWYYYCRILFSNSTFWIRMIPLIYHLLLIYNSFSILLINARYFNFFPIHFRSLYSHYSVILELFFIYCTLSTKFGNAIHSIVTWIILLNTIITEFTILLYPSFWIISL